MKILLVVKSKAIETLGPQYLSAIAKKAGHECNGCWEFLSGKIYLIK